MRLQTVDFRLDFVGLTLSVKILSNLGDFNRGCEDAI